MILDPSGAAVRIRDHLRTDEGRAAFYRGRREGLSDPAIYALDAICLRVTRYEDIQAVVAAIQGVPT
ncbi:MAG TPA: hypothetical protein VLH39_05525 [Magnetospirillaceae bacterium]|nr:hypothetical protein [Magnetospirillaceae bacterium]